MSKIKALLCSLFLVLCYLSCKNPIVTEILPLSPRLLWGSVVIGGNNWVGETLTADTSDLGGSGEITYQWKRGDAAIGANSPDYTIETADDGEDITVTVSRSGNSGTITSNAITAVLQPLSGGAVPVLGKNKIGETLTVDTGGIAGGGGTLGFQWQADGVDIPGADGAGYTIKGADVGKDITCVITRPDAVGNLLTQSLKVPYTLTVYYLPGSPPALGDSLTAEPDTGNAGDTIALNYTVADTAHYNLLYFYGLNTVVIEDVTGAGSGGRAYSVNPADASDGEIIIEAAFEHTDLQPDPIAFTDFTAHIFEIYGEPFANAVTNEHKGGGAIAYSSSHEEVATVDGSGAVTILKVGTTVITAEKPADTDLGFAHASHSYTLTVSPRPLAITPDAGQIKIYGADDPAFTYSAGEALIAGNSFSGALSRISGEIAGIYPFTLGTLTAGNNYTLALDGSNSFAITKADGAAAAQPTAAGAQANGSNTGSITLDSVTLSHNPGGQTVEYAISTESGEAPVNLAWQGNTTFTGLNAGTGYYVYARAAENANYEAGAASVGAAIIFYTVVFDGNGSDSGAVPAVQAALAGAALSIPAKGSLARTGYNFVSWNANSGGTGDNYVPGDSYTVTANTSLYARWGGEQNFSFNVQDIANNDPQVLNANNITLSHSDINRATAVLEVSGAYDSIEWFYGSISLGTGSPLALNVTNILYNQLGAHHITVVGTLSGVPFSSNIRFTVEE